MKWSRSAVSDSLRPVDCSPSSSSVHGILQARILEWVAIVCYFQMVNSVLKNVIHMGGNDFIIFQDLLDRLASFLCFLIFAWGNWSFLVLTLDACVLSCFGCVWLFATSWTVALHGILQARILEWAAISLSRGSSWPRNWTHVSASSPLKVDPLPAEPLGKPSSWVVV